MGLWLVLACSFWSSLKCGLASWATNGYAMERNAALAFSMGIHATMCQRQELLTCQNTSHKIRISCQSRKRSQLARENQEARILANPAPPTLPTCPSANLSWVCLYDTGRTPLFSRQAAGQMHAFSPYPIWPPRSLCQRAVGQLLESSGQNWGRHVEEVHLPCLHDQALDPEHHRLRPFLVCRALQASFRSSKPGYFLIPRDILQRMDFL